MHPQEKVKIKQQNMYACIRIHTNVYIDIYTFIYTPTHMHKHIYILDIHDQVPEDALLIQQQMLIQDGHLPPAKDRTSRHQAIYTKH